MRHVYCNYDLCPVGNERILGKPKLCNSQSHITIAGSGAYLNPSCTNIVDIGLQDMRWPSFPCMRI